MAMRNQFGWDNGRGGFAINVPVSGEDGDAPRTLQIEFVNPTPRRDDPLDAPPPMRDVTPNIRRDYEPPIIDAQVNPPTSVPITGRRRGFNWE